MKTFKAWLLDKWFEHKEECESWRSNPAPDPKTYFRKYKWWLKREYREQLKKEILNEARISRTRYP